jgi:internalin A
MNQNEIEFVQTDMAKLINLTDLQLCYNKLVTLPRHIGYNTSLTRIKLAYNNITSIPGELGLLSNLSDLQLTHNQLQTLPAELGAILPPDGALTELGLTANYFKAPLSQIILRGTAATLRYLREQI